VSKNPDPRPEPFMRRAIELSRQGMRRRDGGPFGAVIVRGGEVVGEGWNRVVAASDPTAHGEVEAIRDACRRLGTFDLSGCELFTSAEPCPMCLAAIYWARIDRVYYGNAHADAAAIGFDDAVISEQLGKPPAERLISETRLLSDEALEVFREYLADPNRVRY
jgi:guanine deaminase